MQSAEPGLGTILALTPGILLGTFAVPMKKMRGWQWENAWLAYCFWSLVVFAWLFGMSTVPGLIPMLLAAPASALMPVFLYGVGWGVGCVLSGLALHLSGLALGTAIVLGLNNALGALLPIALSQPEQFTTRPGLTLAAGVAVMLAGVGCCAWAGSVKQDQAAVRGEPPQKCRIRKGVVLVIVAGILATMFNFALISGDALRHLAEQAGARPANANNAVWCVSLLGDSL
jgi:L-rhamnose-H+ transport protein